MDNKKTFVTFLTQYCKELTNSNTTSLKKLFALASTDYPKAIEPLLLFAIETNRVDYLMRQAKRTPIEKTYRNFLIRWENSDYPLDDYLAHMGKRNKFRKAYERWVESNAKLDKNRKELVDLAKEMKKTILKKNMTRAEACRVAGANKGNFYAFLKGDPTKFNYETAKRMYEKIKKY